MTMRRRDFLGSAIGALLVGCDRGEDGNIEVTLGVAVSLRGVMDALDAAFHADHPRLHVRPVYGASGDLKKRVIDGAPFDGVLFAAGKPVDELVSSGLVDATTRKVVATNQLVLIAPKGSKLALGFQNIDQLPDDEKLAVGDPGPVPAGQYARQALEKLGKWTAVEKRLVLGGDVGQVLAYARRGEVAAAIVYATDVIGLDDVVVLDRAEGDWAPRTEVVAGVLKGAPRARQAGVFLEFVAGPAGAKLFADHGFGPA
jgi:molybdate transport system substrate-binding protein